jgi:hypothetical protein
VTISDNTYAETQVQIQTFSRILLSIDPVTLEQFVRRADRASAVGPVLYPTEYREAAGKLDEVLACARALRDARSRIAQAAAHA